MHPPSANMEVHNPFLLFKASMVFPEAHRGLSVKFCWSFDIGRIKSEEGGCLLQELKMPKNNEWDTPKESGQSNGVLYTDH